MLHRHVRVAADLDFIVDLEAADAERAIRVLPGDGFRPLSQSIHCGLPISSDDLIEMKRQAGRHKDLDDIEQLTKIKAYAKGQTDDGKN